VKKSESTHFITWRINDLNILQLLKSSEKTALIQGAKRISYSKLLDSGLRFGNSLREKTIGKGSHILIFVPLSIELYKAMIGAWSIGAVPIFIDFSRGAKFVNDSIERLKPDLIVCDKVTEVLRRAYTKIRKIDMLLVSVNKVGIDNAVSTENESADAIEQVDPDYPAIMTFTSGTTGVPKVAVRTHGFLINQYNVLTKHMDFDENHIDLGTLPVFTLASMAANMTTLLPDKSYASKINAERLALKMEHEGVTRAICSPALMENLLKYSTLTSLKCAYLGGGPVYPGLLKKINKDVDVHIVYGSTEAEPIASIRWADAAEEEKDKIAHGFGLLVGYVVPEIECKIGEQNEILVTGDTVLKGYLDGIGDKENKIREGNKIWHKTGDAGHIDEKGRLWLLGRAGQAIHDEHGTLYQFCIECILDTHYGIRGAVFASEEGRIIVIEKRTGINSEDILCELRPLHIAEVIEVRKLPMDKRHRAKIDYEKLEKQLLK